jgi:hypothetical protein
MYVEHTVGGWLCDREALATWLGRSRETIKKRVPVVGHLADGTALHNMEHAAGLLAAIPIRRRDPAPPPQRRTGPRRAVEDEMAGCGAQRLGVSGGRR